MQLASIVFLGCLWQAVEGVEVYSAGPDGKPKWQEDKSGWRDKSIVPRPSKESIESYTRSRIPVPAPQLVKHIYVKMPLTDGSDKRSAVPHKSSKKNIIEKIFFTLPIGGQFPIYFSSRVPRGKGHKKSQILTPERRFPKRPYLWRRPFYRQPFKYGRAWLRRRTYTPQQQVPLRRDQIMSSNRMAEGYSPNPLRYAPVYGRVARPYYGYRNIISRGPLQYKPYNNRQLRSLKRSIRTKQRKKTKSPDNSPSRKAVIIKAPDAYRSGLPQGESFEDIMGKLRPRKKSEVLVA
ncbi:uncharacterized protein LOC116617830 isoform X2 [Nematostella vectensis]|uniref:uncharacterized protein LOC116617830 isoform X2 n=1 Tax=Nematostella vectensis TaxID=45351 RepID=UPI0020778275|nr:uncharacterized protein LOC116617830 isoform X2 [Nematostella vectensis]